MGSRGKEPVKVRMFYLVQTFSGPAEAPVPDPVRICDCALAAEALARELAPRHAGVLAYMIEGEPEHGVWGDPDVLAEYGVAMRQGWRAAG